MIEQWKQIPNFKKYEASTFGNIRRVNINKNKKLTQNKGGYLVVSLYIDGVRHVKLVHRIILETFMGVSSLHVNHINENKQDNRLVNLEYVTQLYNNNHGTRNQRISVSNSIPIRCIELNRVFNSSKEASSELDLHATNICNVLKGNRHTTGGYHFEYVK